MINRPPGDTAVSRFAIVQRSAFHTLRTIIPARSKSTNMWKPTVLLAAALAVPAQALHFFIDGAVQKCFFEELPKDTLVVGMTASVALMPGIQLTAGRTLPRRSMERLH